jgi:hypothetical protein
MRRLGGLLATALTLATVPRAQAAPIGPGVEAVTVFSLEAGLEHNFAAKSLTNALRQRVLASDEYTVNGESPPLVYSAHVAKCPLQASRGQPFDERIFTDACLHKIGKQVETKRYFWGFVVAEGSRPFVRLHYWQEGQADRVAMLPYDEALRDRIADRLYRKLVTPEKVGDVALSGAAEGELIVDGAAAGTYAPGAELTLPAGEHALEVRQGQRVVARARTRVASGARAEARLEAVAAPELPAARPVNGPPGVVIRPRPSAWPWVLGGVAVAGMGGAGAFWAFRADAKSDAEGQCDGRVCPESQRNAVERADRYGTFSAVSFGVGLGAGVGLATYLLLAKREPKFVGTVVPVAGGAAVSVGGRF